jgi:hypothetical protein
MGRLGSVRQQAAGLIVLRTCEVGKSRFVVAAIDCFAAGSPFEYVPFSTVSAIVLMVEAHAAED